MKLLILGAGMMGKAAAFFLSGKEDVSQIILADKEKERAVEIAQELKSDKILPAAFDAGDKNRIYELMKECKAAMGATSYDHNLLYTKTAIEAGCSFIDLGGNHDVVDSQFQLHESAKKAGIAVIPDCGLAPGLVNILTAKAFNRLDQTETIQIRVGGVPVKPEPPLNYCLLFSSRGLINEYTEPARIIRDEKVETVNSMDGLETLYFPEPFGKMEAFYTSGGISTLTKTMKDKVKNLDYKTVRYPGHQNYIKFLMDLGLTDSEPLDFIDFKVSPRRVLERVLENHLPQQAQDSILLRVTAKGKEKDIETQYTQEIIDFYDMKNRLTSMMRMTSFPAAVIALMIARGNITDKGVLYQEKSIPTEPFFKELKKVNIAFSERVQQFEQI